MRHCQLPGFGRQTAGFLPRARTAAFAVVALVLAALPLTADAAVPASEEDDLAECDDVGLSQLKSRTWMKTRIHAAKEADVASTGHDNNGHSHRQHHGQTTSADTTASSHGHNGQGRNHKHRHPYARNRPHRRASPLKARRRRRHAREGRAPPQIHQEPYRDGAPATLSADADQLQPAPEKDTTSAAGRHQAAPHTAGLTFIQIGSSINETVQEMPDNDEDELGEEEAQPPAPAVAGGADAETPVFIANGDGFTIATAKAVSHPSQEMHAPTEASPVVGTELEHFEQRSGTGVASERLLGKAAVAALLFSMGAVAVSLCAFAARFGWHAWQQRRLVQGVREKVEKLKVTHGAELEKVFGIHGGTQNQQPMSPGILMRIQGRVVSETQGSLVAPLSGQSCVMYSASVSHQRHDGIHQPVAFRSESIDFAIELSGSPHIRIAVHSHDVVLFDMVDGKRVQECCLSEAADSWRAFLLSNCMPGQDASSSVALGRNDSVLDFRESALMQGVEVTCIGEIARDRNGGLALYPWQPSPPSPAKASRSGSVEFSREEGKGASSWSPVPETVMKLLHRPSPAVPRRESLVGRVMISDHPELIG